jgi:hypothetical protein
MAIVLNRLSDRAVKSLKKPGLHADGGGLYVQISPGGGKSWIFRFSLRGRAREMGLGSCSRISLVDARAERDRCNKLLQEFIDPIEERARRRAANLNEGANTLTFRQAAERAIPIFTRKLTNARHVRQWTTSIEQFAFPTLGRMSVRDITVHDVYRALEPVWQTTGETASRVRARIERILDWCRVNGFCAGANAAAWEGNLDLLLGGRTKGRAARSASLCRAADVRSKVAQSG